MHLYEILLNCSIYYTGLVAIQEKKKLDCLNAQLNLSMGCNLKSKSCVVSQPSECFRVSPFPDNENRQSGCFATPCHHMASTSCGLSWRHSLCCKHCSVGCTAQTTMVNNQPLHDLQDMLSPTSFPKQLCKWSGMKTISLWPCQLLTEFEDAVSPMRILFGNGLAISPSVTQPTDSPSFLTWLNSLSA